MPNKGKLETTVNKKAAKHDIREAIVSKLARYYATTPEEATEIQMYKAVSLCVKDELTKKASEFKKEYKTLHKKKLYYLCMEFLMGRQLRNNLRNLGEAEAYGEVLSEFGFDIDKIYNCEPDPGLGNGGLGRLAACFMDSLTTLDYHATGFSICYEYGLFKQRIIDGEQIELPDVWMPDGDVWLVPRQDKKFTVRFGGHVDERWNDGKLEVIYEDYEELQAVPYDMMVSGADCQAVNTLRLFKAKPVQTFDMGLFSQGQYIKAMEDSNNADIISKVLYPSDNHMEGKFLRLSQQYFLVSASIQSIISDHLAAYGTLSNFADKVAIHINDTHPALVIPEMMRIFVDTYSYKWEEAWAIVKATVSYTNHTVMPEALEVWPEDLLRVKLPRIHSIVCEINRRFCSELWQKYTGDWDRISRMSIIASSQVRMANLSIVGSHTVNGVSRLHSEILKNTVFHDFYKNEPEMFTNVTNGIAHRRWLCYSNPRLAALLDECIGTGYRKSPEKLADFAKYKGDAAVYEQLEKIKRENKAAFALKLQNKTGIKLDPDSVFDVQIKRMHEYKRQLLNAIKIISIYNDLLENPDKDITPQTFIFGAKAAPGYYMAKNIIKLIYYIGQDIEKNPKLKDKIKVVFLEDYNVSLAEILIPAADISEQISLAGKEASGTGNMKLMINGAVTLGTLDGANVEISEAVGKDNIYIFGLTTEEVDDLWKRGYHSLDYYNNSTVLKNAVDRMAYGFDGVSFENMRNYLIYAQPISDPYMCLADFESYKQTHDRLIADYADRNKWVGMSLTNIASAGVFASDRSIGEYARNIWGIEPAVFKKSKK